MVRRKPGEFDRQVRKALLNDLALENLHNYRVDRHSFTIYVGGDPGIEDYEGHGQEPGVEHRMADRFDLNLGILSGISKSRPILVQVASCGGNWDEGMQMMGAILTCPNPVTVIATKWARSMTSIIPLAADRFLLRPPAKYMFHHGSYGIDGTVQEALTDNIELVKMGEMMRRIYIARLKEQGAFSKWSQLRIRQMLDRHMERKTDVWLDGEEAVEWGFCDGIYTGEVGVRAKTRNKDRRERMMAVLRRPIKVEVKVS